MEIERKELGQLLGEAYARNNKTLRSDIVEDVEKLIAPLKKDVNIIGLEQIRSRSMMITMTEDIAYIKNRVDDLLDMESEDIAESYKDIEKLDKRVSTLEKEVATLKQA